PTTIGDLEPVRDLLLEGAWLAAIRCGWVGHQLQGEHLLLLAAEQREDAMRRQFSQRLAEVEIVGELGAGLCLASANSRTEDGRATTLPRARSRSAWHLRRSVLRGSRGRLREQRRNQSLPYSHRHTGEPAAPGFDRARRE